MKNQKVATFQTAISESGEILTDAMVTIPTHLLILCRDVVRQSFSRIVSQTVMYGADGIDADLYSKSKESLLLLNQALLDLGLNHSYVFPEPIEALSLSPKINKALIKYGYKTVSHIDIMLCIPRLMEQMEKEIGKKRFKELESKLKAFKQSKLKGELIKGDPAKPEWIELKSPAWKDLV